MDGMLLRRNVDRGAGVVILVYKIMIVSYNGSTDVVIHFFGNQLVLTDPPIPFKAIIHLFKTRFPPYETPVFQDHRHAGLAGGGSSHCPALASNSCSTYTCPHPTNHPTNRHLAAVGSCGIPQGRAPYFPGGSCHRCSSLRRRCHQHRRGMFCPISSTQGLKRGTTTDG